MEDFDFVYLIKRDVLVVTDTNLLLTEPSGRTRATLHKVLTSIINTEDITLHGGT